MKPEGIEIEALNYAMIDYTGLYELIDCQNKPGSTSTLGEKYDAAAAAVRSLYAQGWIEFVEQRRTGTEFTYRPFVPDDVDQLLGKPSSWYQENFENVTICILATDAGKEGFYQKYSRL